MDNLDDILNEFDNRPEVVEFKKSTFKEEEYPMYRGSNGISRPASLQDFDNLVMDNVFVDFNPHDPDDFIASFLRHTLHTFMTVGIPNNFNFDEALNNYREIRVGDTAIEREINSYNSDIQNENLTQEEIQLFDENISYVLNEIRIGRQVADYQINQNNINRMRNATNSVNEYFNVNSRQY